MLQSLVTVPETNHPAYAQLEDHLQNKRLSSYSLNL